MARDRFIDTLINYVRDIKPYHVKIYDVSVEYRREEDVNVTVLEDINFYRNKGFNYNTAPCFYNLITGLDRLEFGEPIISIDRSTRTFVLRDDKRSAFETTPIDQRFGKSEMFFVVGHPDADGEYTISQITYDSTTNETRIVVNQPIPGTQTSGGKIQLPYKLPIEDIITIIDSSKVANDFVVPGNWTKVFVTDYRFLIRNSGGNDCSPIETGVYWIKTSTLDLRYYDGTSWSSPLAYTRQSTAPSSPAVNDLWFNTDENVLYIWRGINWDNLFVYLQEDDPLADCLWTVKKSKFDSFTNTTRITVRERIQDTSSLGEIYLPIDDVLYVVRDQFKYTKCEISPTDIVVTVTESLNFIDIVEKLYFRDEISVAVSDYSNSSYGGTYIREIESIDINQNTIVFGEPHGWTTGSAISFDSDQNVPAPLDKSRDYFAIFVDRKTVMVAETPDDAYNGIAINLTTQGSGSQYAYVRSKYTFGGKLPNMPQLQFSVDPVTNVFTTTTDHEFVSGMTVIFHELGTLPNPIAEDEKYFVIVIDNRNFVVVENYNVIEDGSVYILDFTTQGTGTHSLTVETKQKFSTDFTVDSTTNIITLSQPAPWEIGDEITFSTTGALPEPLNSQQIYYIIPLTPTTGYITERRTQIITNKKTIVDIIDSGTGINTVQQYYFATFDPIAAMGSDRAITSNFTGDGTTTSFIVPYNFRNVPAYQVVDVNYTAEANNSTGLDPIPTIPGFIRFVIPETSGLLTPTLADPNFVYTGTIAFSSQTFTYSFPGSTIGTVKDLVEQINQLVGFNGRSFYDSRLQSVIIKDVVVGNGSYANVTGDLLNLPGIQSIIGPIPGHTATTYTADITYDSTTVTVSILGYKAQTYRELFSEFNKQVGFASLGSTLDNNLIVRGNTYTTNSQVIINDNNLFQSLNSFRFFENPTNPEPNVTVLVDDEIAYPNSNYTGPYTVVEAGSNVIEITPAPSRSTNIIITNHINIPMFAVHKNLQEVVNIELQDYPTDGGLTTATKTSQSQNVSTSITETFRIYFTRIRLYDNIEVTVSESSKGYIKPYGVPIVGGWDTQFWDVSAYGNDGTIVINLSP